MRLNKNLPVFESSGAAIAGFLALGALLLLQPAYAGGKKPAPPPVPVRCGTASTPPCPVYDLEVDIADQIPGQGGISSDFQVPYFQGLDGVTARLGTGGAFTFYTGTDAPCSTGQSATRYPVIDYDDPIAV